MAVRDIMCSVTFIPVTRAGQETIVMKAAGVRILLSDSLSWPCMMNLFDKVHSDSRKAYTIAYDLKPAGLNPAAAGNDTTARRLRFWSDYTAFTVTHGINKEGYHTITTTFIF